MSTHSLTFSVLGDLGVCGGGALIPGEVGGCGGCGNGTTVEEVRGMTWACLEIEDE
jgi:hypothetical protein